MSELILVLTAVVAFALVHAADPRRFPAGERWWRRLAARPVGGAARTLLLLAAAVLLTGTWVGARQLGGVAAALVLASALMAAGSTLVLAVPLWPRATWRICGGCALALPLLAIAQVRYG